MQEIAKGIYFDDTYAGVSLGAINMPHGLILIDAPPRVEDARLWRGVLLNMGGGVDRLLVNLDAHIDRTLGVRAMECTVVAHEKAAQVFRTRPTTFKAPTGETGAEWETLGGLTGIRWAPPEMTFTQQMTIHWGESPVLLEYRPGPTPGAIWVIVPEEHIIFVGDAIVPNQPPFLANADIPAWIESLQPLLEPHYRDYLFISGRNGLAGQKEVRRQVEYLQRVLAELEELAAAKEPTEATERLVPGLLSGLKYPADRKQMYTQRLAWGLSHYYTRHFRPNSVESEE